MNSHFYIEQIIVVVCYLVEIFNIETVNKRNSQILSVCQKINFNILAQSLFKQ